MTLAECFIGGSTVWECSHLSAGARSLGFGVGSQVAVTGFDQNKCIFSGRGLLLVSSRRFGVLRRQGWLPGREANVAGAIRITGRLDLDS